MCAAEHAIDTCHKNCSILPLFGYSVRAQGKKKGIVDLKLAAPSLLQTHGQHPGASVAEDAGTAQPGVLMLCTEGDQHRKWLFPICLKLPI